jgi:hypothetical protein
MSLGNLDESDKERFRNALLLKELTEETLKGMDQWRNLPDNSPAQQRAIEQALNDPKGREYLQNNPELKERLEEMRHEGAKGAQVAHVNAITALENQRREAAERGDVEAVKQIDRSMDVLNDNYAKNHAAHPPAADESGMSMIKNIAGYAVAFAGINSILGGIGGINGLTDNLPGSYGAEMNMGGAQAMNAAQGMQGIFAMVQEAAGASIGGPGMDMGMGMNNMNNMGMQQGFMPGVPGRMA